MPNEEKDLPPSSSADERGELAQRAEKIEDLSPTEGEANDVRGGILPPNELRVYAIPPQE